MRVILFVATNFALMIVLSIVCAVLGVDSDTTAGLVTLSLVFGMGGAVISLLMSKMIAKWTTGAKVINGSENEQAQWLVRTVDELSRQANVRMPEVAIYPGEPNAFATGAFRNSALVAVSTGLMQGMSRQEVRAVLGHELGHVANGDMVTMTLLQGVLNSAVILLSRVIGSVVDSAISGDSRNRRGPGLGYYLTYYVMQILLGLLASMIVMAYSRRREYAADASASRYLGSPTDMIRALQRLGSMTPGALPESMKAFGISGRASWAHLFSSHPPLEARIKRLQQSQIVL